jgi:flagellar biosynthesis/type III secretory pathway protein FliH
MQIIETTNQKETEMKTNFNARAAKIISKIHTGACIDTEALEEILKAELEEYYDELHEYYEEEYSNAIASVRSKAYDTGYDDGFNDGYENLLR